MCRYGTLIGIFLGCISLYLTGCESNPNEVRLFVAASLADVARDWQADYRTPERSLIFHGGGSALLAQQILRGAGADLFVSAGPTPVNILREAGMLVRVDTAFMHNRLLLVCRDDLKPPLALRDIVHARFERIAMADPTSAPAGEYARAGLMAVGLWDALRERIIYAADVRATLGAVATGAVDMGFVYATDAATYPDLYTTDPGFPSARYLLAMVAPETPEKISCWNYLRSRAGRRIVTAQGFSP